MTWDRYVTPFSYGLWLAATIAACALAVCLALTNCSHKRNQNLSLSSILFYIHACFCQQGQSYKSNFSPSYFLYFLLPFVIILFPCFNTDNFIISVFRNFPSYLSLNTFYWPELISTSRPLHHIHFAWRRRWMISRDLSSGFQVWASSFQSREGSNCSQIYLLRYNVHIKSVLKLLHL